MEPERARELRKVAPRLLLGLLAVESFTLPIFRSGGRKGLSFWGWVWNHTIFGPPVEYVPVEDYAREMQGEFPWYPVTEASHTLAEGLIDSGEISVIAGEGQPSIYRDLLANVRNDRRYHSVKSLVQPDDPTVRDVARILVQGDDFIMAAQEFVDSFTTYQKEAGDYWKVPSEILTARAGDCDCKAILLTSILRNYLPADEVYCAFGLWLLDGVFTGHMYVVTLGEDGQDRIIEATASPDDITRGKYILHGMFNDKYAFATDIGLREFDIRGIDIESSFRRR